MNETYVKLIELLSPALRRPIHAAGDGASPKPGARMSDASSQGEDDLSDKGGSRSNAPLAEHTGACSSRNGSCRMTRDCHDVLDLSSPRDSYTRDRDRDWGLGVDADMFYLRAAADGVGTFYV